MHQYIPVQTDSKLSFDPNNIFRNKSPSLYGPKVPKNFQSMGGPMTRVKNLNLIMASDFNLTNINRNGPMWNLNESCGVSFGPSVMSDYEAKIHQYNSSTSETSALVTKARLSNPNPALHRILRDP